MMDISDRIYLLRTDQGLSQSKFATATGSSTSTISKIETRKAIPTDRLIKTICGIFLVNEDWLRTRSGQIYLHVKYGYEFAEVYDKLCPEMKELAIKIIKDILETQKNNR